VPGSHYGYKLLIIAIIAYLSIAVVTHMALSIENPLEIISDGLPMVKGYSHKVIDIM